MSKAMVAVDADSQNGIIGVNKGLRKVVSSEQVDSWLEETGSGKYLLTCIIPANVKDQYRGVNLKNPEPPPIISNLFTVSFGSGAGGFFLSAFICIGIGTAHGAVLPDLVWLSSVILGTVLGASIWFPIFAISNKKKRTFWSYFLTIQSKGLKNWLRVRYNVIVTAEVLADLASAVLWEKPTISFTDMDGHNWVLNFNAEGKGYQLDPQQVVVKPTQQEALLQQAPVKIAVGTYSLPESAQKIVDSIDTRLSQLHKFALSTEQSHVVARTVEDAREAVAAFERLDALGAGESGLERLVSILCLLDGELEKIVQTRITEESVGFASRQKSVEARVSGVGV